MSKLEDYDIKKIAEEIKQKGGRLYLVGGAVRDKLLNKVNHDEDYCVVGLESDEFERIFPNAIKRGKDFEVFDLYGKEFAMARLERKVGKGHKGFEIISGRNVTLLEDLKRRDITINSIAQDVLTKEIIDPFNRKRGFRKKSYKGNF